MNRSKWLTNSEVDLNQSNECVDELIGQSAYRLLWAGYFSEHGMWPVCHVLVWEMVLRLWVDGPCNLYVALWILLKVGFVLLSFTLTVSHAIEQWFPTTWSPLKIAHFACLLNQPHLIQVINSLVETPRPEMNVSDMQRRHAKCAMLRGLQEHGWELLL